MTVVQVIDDLRQELKCPDSFLRMILKSGRISAIAKARNEMERKDVMQLVRELYRDYCKLYELDPERDNR